MRPSRQGQHKIAQRFSAGCAEWDMRVRLGGRHEFRNSLFGLGFLGLCEHQQIFLSPRSSKSITWITFPS
jgi:hypothetical protein